MSSLSVETKALQSSWIKSWSSNVGNISYTLESELRFIPVTSEYHLEQCQVHSEHLKPLLLLGKVLKKSFWKSEEFICTVYVHGEGNGTPLQYSCLENPMDREPGRLQSMRLLRVGYNWATSLSLFTFMHWRRKWQPTLVFLPGESQGQGSLVGCCLWGLTESDTTEVT